MYFVQLGRGVIEKGKKTPDLPGMTARCLFVVAKWLCRCGEVSGLARAVCYLGSTGPPGVPSCWPESEGLSLREGEESKPLPKDG